MLEDFLGFPIYFAVRKLTVDNRIEGIAQRIVQDKIKREVQELFYGQRVLPVESNLKTLIAKVDLLINFLGLEYVPPDFKMKPARYKKA